MSYEHADRRSNRRPGYSIAGTSVLLASVAILGLVLTFRMLGTGPQGVRAAPAQCGSGLSDDITQDTTWSEDVYIDGSIKVKDGSTLTITPGTQVLFCGAYDLQIGALFSPGRLVAEGAVDQPITFGAASDQNWGELSFLDALDRGASVVGHVVLEDGGGTDATQGQTIHVSSRAPLTHTASPRIYGVTVRGSNGYGITVNAVGGDPKPAQLTNVTVEGSTLHPVNVDVNAVGGIGAGFEVTGNNPDRIRVFGNRMNFDSRWRDHGVPYEVTESFSMRSNYPNEDVVPAVWTIDPGITLFMHPDVEINVGSLYGEGQVMAKGTPEDRITITRLADQGAPWAGFTFGGHTDVDSEFEHVDLLYGGSTLDNRDAVINKRGTSQVRLQNVSIRHSLNGAIWVFGGDVWVKESVITNNRYGIDVQARARATVRGSDLSNNAEFALRNGSPNKVCLDAAGNFWGPGGPSDTSAAEDACGSTRTNDGTATVSDGVTYTPWQTADAGSFGAIQAQKFWVIADGESSSEITVRLIDEQGQPLSGKEVDLETNLGTLQQPTTPTDENGETTGVISSTETGFATVVAFNATDDEPVPGTAGINFWQGSADFGGLADPTGAPYASPALELEGKPFQAGFPVEMRMPIRNTRANPVGVEVVYGVSNLAIGTHFTPVYSDTRTLEIGETWDARGVWVPQSAGHHCIQGKLIYSDTEGQVQALDSGSGTRQVNTNENPCSGLPSNPNDYHPGEPEGGSEDIKTIAEHFKEMVKYTRDATDCIDEEVTLQSLDANQSGPRDYEVIVSVPSFTPPTVTTADGLTQAQVDAYNALNATGARVLGLSRALGATRQRMEGAAQAGELGDLDRQYSAFLDFVEEYAQALRTLADQHDDLLAATRGAGVADAYYQPEDFEDAFNDLVKNGFDAGTVDFLEQSGLSQDLIEEIRQDIIKVTEGNTFEVTSFYQTVRDSRDEARRIARELERRYGLGAQASDQVNERLIRTEPQIFDFTVSHQSDQEETVNLDVRPVSLPMDWSARLDRETVTLGTGESVSSTLTLVPGESIPEASRVEVAVEGYVDGNLIGGIVFTYNAPVVSEPRTGGQIFLPLTLREF